MKRLSFLTKKNLFLVLSAASFFGLYNSPGVGYAVGFVLALLILILYLSQYTTSPEQRHSIPFSVFILLSALGISNMWLAVFGDVGVTILAVLNSLRLLRKQK